MLILELFFLNGKELCVLLDDFIVDYLFFYKTSFLNCLCSDVFRGHPGSPSLVVLQQHRELCGTGRHIRPGETQAM